MRNPLTDAKFKSFRVTDADRTPRNSAVIYAENHEQAAGDYIMRSITFFDTSMSRKVNVCRIDPLATEHMGDVDQMIEVTIIARTRRVS